MKNASLLLEIGNNMYCKTKNYIFFAPGGFLALLITVALCGEYAAAYLLLSGHYAFVNFLVFMWYIFIAIGLCVVWPYFMGLILIGIGQIAENTCPKATDVPQKSDAASKIVTPSIRAEEARKTNANEAITNEWICENCQKSNHSSRNVCWYCGENK